MAAPVIEIVRLFVGRGLRVNPFGETDEKLELSVDLGSLDEELDTAMQTYEAMPGRIWMPLTTTVGGVPDLVWEDDDTLVPTLITVGDI